MKVPAILDGYRVPPLFGSARCAEPNRASKRSFSYVAIDARIPADQPLRAMKTLLELLAVDLTPQFAAIYADSG